MEMNHCDDYKYFMQDIGTIFVGANYTYQEVLEHEDIPFKLKEAVNRVFMKDKDKQTTFAGHLALVKEGEMSYLAFHQIKPKIKITFLKKEGGGKKSSLGFKNDYYSFDEFMEKYQESVRRDECFVEEICIRKLHLMGFSI